MYYLYNNGEKKRIFKDLVEYDVTMLTTAGYIKSQSENVFGLIEVGDLVEVFKCREIGKITKKDFHYDNYNELEVNYRDGVFTYHIMAIYKPNKNGDYIKVWERESEE